MGDNLAEEKRVENSEKKRKQIEDEWKEKEEK